MYNCMICNSDIEIWLDDKGFYQIKPCSKCIKTTYAEGVRTGFKLAGGNVEELAEEFKDVDIYKNKSHTNDLRSK